MEPLYGEMPEVTTRQNLNLDAKGEHTLVPFLYPPVDGQLRWVTVYRLQLKAKKGWKLTVFGGCSVSAKEFWQKKDAKGKPIYLSMYPRVDVRLSAHPLPDVFDADRPDGLLVSHGPGMNLDEVDNRAPYYPCERADAVTIPWDDPTLAMYVAGASDSAFPGSHIQVYGTEKGWYGYLTAIVKRPIDAEYITAMLGVTPPPGTFTWPTRLDITGGTLLLSDSPTGGKK